MTGHFYMRYMYAWIPDKAIGSSSQRSTHEYINSTIKVHTKSAGFNNFKVPVLQPPLALFSVVLQFHVCLEPVFPWFQLKMPATFALVFSANKRKRKT